MAQKRIPAVYMRGGTSKGVFFHAADLPADPTERDRLLLRVIGSPDPYGKHIDGMGGATSSTSKVVILSPSKRPDADVDYLFGQVPIDRAHIDWSGNCGNLTAAVGPFALSSGLVKGCADGWTPVRIWQVNIGKHILAQVQMRDGEVLEEGDFEFDGVPFPSAEVRLDFLDPGGSDDDAAGGTFPTGLTLDTLDVPGVGQIEATLINAGNPTVLIDASALGLLGTECAAELDSDQTRMAALEAIRAHGAVAMGLAKTAAEASATRLHTPKIAFVAAPLAYTATSGKAVAADDIDINVRIVSIGKLHHAITGTGGVAVAVAAAIPGTVIARTVGRSVPLLRIGHPSGVLRVGAEAVQADGGWQVTKASMSRSARRLMEGFVCVPNA